MTSHASVDRKNISITYGTKNPMNSSKAVLSTTVSVEQSSRLHKLSINISQLFRFIT